MRLQPNPLAFRYCVMVESQNFEKVSAGFLKDIAENCVSLD